MSKVEVYRELMDWLKQADPLLTDSEDTTALIKARYTPEDAVLLTGIPFGYSTIEALAELKQMSVKELQPRLDALAKKVSCGRPSPMARTAIGFAIHSLSSIDPPTWAGKEIPSTIPWPRCSTGPSALILSDLPMPIPGD